MMGFERAMGALKQAAGDMEESVDGIARQRSRPAQLLLAGYTSYILMGWIALSFPIAQAKPIGALDNLFMAVSAVSTTGLVTVDTGTSYTFFGQIVLLALIQFGGLGYMAAGSFLFLMVRNRMSETQEATARTSYSLPDSISPRLFIRSVVVFTLICETSGALALFYFFHQAGTPDAIWSAIFHSVSAFCTAGFSLYSNSFEGFAGDVGVTLTISVLSILGGVGFIVVTDMVRRFTGRTRHYGFASKVILRLTLALLAIGTILVFLVEKQIAGFAPWLRLLTSFFQAMSASTTVGFNTSDIASLSKPTIMILLMLMFIGASPAGTGGGLKTTSLAALIGLVRSTLKGRDRILFFKRRILKVQIQAAMTSFCCYVGMLSVAIFLLSLTDPAAPFEVAIFEAVSAIGTVGLSMGLTSDLTTLGKFVIITLMIIGRLGVLTFGLATAIHEEDVEEQMGDSDLAL